MSNDVIYERQQERKRSEHWYGPWDEYRQALIDSGMVRDAWQRRHREAFGYECDTPEKCEHYALATGMAQA